MKDSPAFPQTAWSIASECGSGITARQYFAAKLLQPNSGLDWLDDMILARMRDEALQKAVAAWIGALSLRHNEPGYRDEYAADEAVRLAKATVDMMKQREER